jgi:hypothetical protein
MIVAMSRGGKGPPQPQYLGRMSCTPAGISTSTPSATQGQYRLSFTAIRP